jgi:Flp pilus assembly protein TadD
MEILSSRLRASELSQQALEAVERGDFALAEAQLAEAARLDPAVPMYRCNLATTRLCQGKAQLAYDGLRQAADPLEALDCATLGQTLKSLGAAAEAVTWMKRALLLDPRQVSARITLANLQSEAGLLEEAIQTLRLGLGDAPEHGPLLNNLGLALHEAGHLEEALAVFERIRHVAPQTPGTALNRAHSLLLMGRWREGFAAYEARPLPPSPSRAPHWNGQATVGATLLIRAEQGLGDAVQFARFISLARIRMGRVVLLCDKTLHRLFEGVCELADETQPPPPHDLQCPLLSLPHLLGLADPEITAPAVYLKPPAPLSLPGTFKVGLVWSGRRGHANDKNRSLDPKLLEPLLKVHGATFYSLQIGRGTPPEGMTDLAPSISDLYDTARAIMGLDLLISADTAPAHLAGALNKPVWTLLPFAPDWRWGLNGETTPWYPSMRLLRQPRLGDWSGVIEKAAKALRTNAGSGNPNPNPSSS